MSYGMTAAYRRYEQEVEMAFEEEAFINEWTEWYMNRGYSAEDAEELAEEKLKEEYV